MNKILIKIYPLLPVIVQQYWKRIEESDIGSRIAKGAFWSLTGSIISQGLMLIASIVVARILGKVEFGELGIIRSTVNMFAVFASFGLGLTATKFIAEFKIRDKSKTGKIIGITTLFAGGSGGIIAILIIIAAPFLATTTLNSPHLVNEIRLSAIMLFFSALIGAQTGTLAGFEAFKTIAKVNLVAGILAFPIQIGFTFWFGLSGSVIGFGLNFMILWVLNFIAVRKEARRLNVNIQFFKLKNELPLLYKFSLPALLSSALVGPTMWICNTFLVNKPNGFEQMAIFDAANQWRSAILFIPAILAQITLPLLADSLNDQNHFNKILKVNLIINFSFSFFIATIISLFSGVIMRFYGENFVEGNVVLIILAFSTILISINNVIGQAMAGKSKIWIGFFLNLIWSIILIITSLIFINLGDRKSVV